MAFLSKFTGPEIDRRLAQGTYDDAVNAGFTGTKEQFDELLAHPYDKIEQEKLNNKQDKEDPALETENKTVVGAINLLNSNKQDKTDERLTTDSKIVVEAINEVKYGTIVLDQKKQPREDQGFSTEQKTVVGAVNELHLNVQDLEDNKQNKVDDALDTNDTTVVGAINEVHGEHDKLNAEFGKHLDDYEEFKSATGSNLTGLQESITNLRTDKQDKTDYDLVTEDKRVVFAINEVHDALDAEVKRATDEDARLEKVKVPYTDISDGDNPNRRTILLNNHDSISGFGTSGDVAYNIAMVSKWDKADFGAAGIPINLNGSAERPTYNDDKELAFKDEVVQLNETIATVNENLTNSISALNQTMTDEFNAINGSINNEIRPAIEENKAGVDKNAKDIAVVNENLTNKIEETEEKLQEDINYLKPRVATLETLQIKSVNPDSENYAASYELQDSTGKAYGVKINVAKDQFLKSVGYADNILTLTFILADGTEYPQQIDLTGLVDEYIAGAGISVTTTDDGKKVINIADDALQKIQYADSEVRRLEQDKIPYAYDEKTQSKINVILPEGGSYLGNYGDENATVAKAAVYDGVKQLEIGSSKIHTNINTLDNLTVELPEGKRTVMLREDELPSNEVRVPVRSLKDQIYSKEDILGWFGVEDVIALKNKIVREGQLYFRFGISLSGNPMYYKMPVDYVAFESANQIKLVFLGLDTSNDKSVKYTIVMNLDGTIIEGNSNVKVTMDSLEVDLSEYATVIELNDKVDKVDGKGLSTEDYTTAEKEKLASLENYDDTSLRSELQQTETGVATANTEIEKLKSGKQDALVSGENIKTINGESLLGSGNIEITGGSSEVTWDNVTGKPSFATVATSGSYSDLTGTPDLSSYQSKSDDTLNTTDKTVVGAINELMAKITELEQKIVTLEGGGSNNYNLTELTDVSNGVCNRLNVTPNDFIRTDNNLQYIKLNVDDQDKVLIPYNNSTESVHANSLMLIYGRSDPQFKFNKDDFSLSGKVYNSTTSSWDYKSYSFRTAYDEDAYTSVVFYDANLKDSRDDSVTYLSDIYVVKSFEEKYDQMMQEIEDMNLPDPPQE